MSSSLRDQLVKAGLASKQSANAQNAKSRKKHKKPRTTSASDIAAKKIADAKREKDRILNAELQAKQEKSTIKGQIKVLIETHAMKEYKGEQAFNYQSGNKIRQLFVTDNVHKKLSADQLAITRLNGKTFLVPRDIAEKVLVLNADWAVSRPGASDEKTDNSDDPYADYQVPDDLSW